MISGYGGRLAAVLVTGLIAACATPVAAVDPPAFDGGKAYDHVRAMVGFGPRPAGSVALEQTRQYIRAQFAAMGVQVADQAFEAETPIGKVKMVNVRATIPGTRPERIIFAGHYDTKLFREFRFVGANDGGSSAALLIELARVLKARKNTFTLEFLFLDGEEATGPDWYLQFPCSTGRCHDNTYGSRYYVAQAKKAGELGQIKAMILGDMIGERDLVIKRETRSTPWLTDLIWAAARTLGHQATFVAELQDVEDDHVPFLNAGVAAVDVIDLDYPPWHTAEDTLDKVSARSMETVGQVLVAALPKIETRLAGPSR
jgi:Zn-dependent M28 family amino/carboxypeptidase